MKTVRPWVPILLLFTVLLVAGFDPIDRTLVADVQRGDRAASEQRYSEALRAYARAAQRCPGCPQPYLHSGAVYVSQERYDEAQAAYLSATRLGGLGDATMEGLAALHVAEGSPQLAVDELAFLLAHRPKRGDLWIQLGEAHRALDEPIKARQAFERALALDISDEQRQVVHDWLGVLCLETDSESGMLCAQEQWTIVERGPDLILAANAARLTRALSHVAQGGTTNDRALARAELGEALYHHSDLTLARGQFEAALSLEPQYVDAHAYLGHVLSLLGDAQGAVQHLEQAIALEPAYTLPRYFLGMHYVRRGGWVTGRDVLEQAHDVDPYDPAICAAIADTHLRGDTPWYDVAEQWFQAAIDRAPTDPRFHLLLAHFYVDRALDPGVRGVAAARATIALDPDSSEAYETLGWAYHLGGRSGLALQPLEQALALSATSVSHTVAVARIHYRLGEVYRALGQSERAYQHLEMAADLDWHGPVGERARESLAQVKKS